MEDVLLGDVPARNTARLGPEAGQTPDEIGSIAFAAERLVAYKLPRGVEFTRETLRDEAGKARRGQLWAERIAARQAGESK